MADAAAWSVRDDGVTLRVRLTPKSSRDAIEGVERLADGSAVLKARVRAVPEGGKANTALAALLAKALGVARGAVALQAGQTSRLKTVRVSGDPAALTVRLRDLAASGGA